MPGGVCKNSSPIPSTRGLHREGVRQEVPQGCIPASARRRTLSTRPGVSSACVQTPALLLNMTWIKWCVEKISVVSTGGPSRPSDRACWTWRTRTASNTVPLLKRRGQEQRGSCRVCLVEAIRRQDADTLNYPVRKGLRSDRNPLVHRIRRGVWSCSWRRARLAGQSGHGAAEGLTRPASPGRGRERPSSASLRPVHQRLPEGGCTPSPWRTGGRTRSPPPPNALRRRASAAALRLCCPTGLHPP